ncbi:MAG: hypothetical protein ABSE54_01665 [Smithella sp.]|jgi:hypothetical protein
MSNLKIQRSWKKILRIKALQKELLLLLNSMPDHIIEPYVTLLKLEKQILKGSRS